MSDAIIHLITSAVKAYGAAQCAVPHIKIESETTSTDLEINDDARWSLKVTLTDRVRAEGEAPSEEDVPAARFLREWSVTASDYSEALTALCRTILIDLHRQMTTMTNQLNAIGDAIDILGVVVPVEEAVAHEAVPQEDVIKPKFVQVEANLHPAR
jgi:hypothetical protein